MKKKVLVISGGGIKGIKFLGALHYLQSEGMLDDISYYGGTSIGGLLSFLICIGYDPIELITYICSKKIFSKKIIPDIFSMMNNGGALEYCHFNDIIEKIIINKIGVLPTLGKIYEMFQKHVMFTTYNYTKNQVEYISSETHPDINCMTAIRMTCNIPLIFGKFTYDNCEYIDGGVYDIFPVNFFTKMPNTEIIGIVVSDQLLYEKDDTIMHYIHNLFFIPIREVLKSVLNSLDKEQNTIIYINDEKVQSWNLQSSTPATLNMFSDGFEECKKNLKRE
jgi:predicted acylesterase/phospholipase RssA